MEKYFYSTHGMLLKKFIAENKDEVRLIWQNSFFDLYSDLK